MAALVHFAHPEIRKVALEAATNSQWMGLAIKMLTLNWGVGDFHIIEGLLRSAADADTIHDLGWGFRHLREVNKSADAERP